MTNFFEKCWIRMLLVLVLLAGLVGQTRAAEAPPQGQEDPLANDPVEIAIRKGVQYLYSQEKNGNWEASPTRQGMENADPNGLQWGGVTSMAVYGLLAAGENSQDPKVAAALRFLDKADVIGTYAMGMKLQSWNYIVRPTPAQKQVIKKDAQLLMGGVNVKEGAARGLYHYSTTADDTYDLSCSNYGVLGMWAAAQQNLEIPTAYWKLVDEAWRNQQNGDGGFQYMNGGPKGKGESTLPMTAAGVATLFITQEMLNTKHDLCTGNIVDPNIERGLEWLSKNYGGLGNLYAMYNVERVGTASGYKYFGTVDWYKQGAEFLVKNQNADGSWNPGGHGNNITGTVWALLFLVKGRAPVMMNKLEYAIDLHGDKGKTNWNERPRDIANLARWTAEQLEKELNWQIVNLKVDIQDLHDAPIIYMSGNQLLLLTKEEKDKLRQYVEGGGMILGHADCNDQRFSNSFMKLGKELFPTYEFRDLPKDHLIYNVQFNGNLWPSKPILKGLSNGAREMMVLIPAGDPSQFWQIKNFSSGRTKPMAELAANIYLYAIDKSTLKGKFKGQSYIVKRDENAKTARTVKIARLEYGGNWNPEPGGWTRMSNLMHNTRGTDLEIETVKLGEGKLGKDYQIAHLTGTVKFRLTQAQRDELKAFVAGGGTLVVDAAGGSADFKDAAEAELKTDFGVAAPLPLESPVYSATGEKLTKASYRKYTQKLLLGALNAPRLRGIDVNKRTAVIYSPEDLSVGIVGMTIDGIYGYEPAYATKLMESIIMYASGGAPANVAANGKVGDAQPAAATDKPVHENKPNDKAPGDKPVATPAGKKPIAKK